MRTCPERTEFYGLMRFGVDDGDGATLGRRPLGGRVVARSRVGAGRRAVRHRGTSHITGILGRHIAAKLLLGRHACAIEEAG